jgi:hypothetical protein
MLFNAGADHVKTIGNLKYDLREGYEAVRDRNRES